MTLLKSDDISGSADQEGHPTNGDNETPKNLSGESKTEMMTSGKQTQHHGHPGGGYGWVVVFGSFTAYFIQKGLSKSEGIYFLQFLDKFGSSAHVTAWPFAISASLDHLMGPVAGQICRRYRCV